ncbi:hypothetical protein SNK03_009204 [Fusarium graminearum]
MADTFDSVLELPPSLRAVASQLVQYAGTCVKVETDGEPNQETHRFDWQSFMNSVNDRPTDDLSFDT